MLAGGCQAAGWELGELPVAVVLGVGFSPLLTEWVPLCGPFPVASESLLELVHAGALQLARCQWCCQEVVSAGETCVFILLTWSSLLWLPEVYLHWLERLADASRCWQGTYVSHSFPPCWSWGHLPVKLSKQGICGTPADLIRSPDPLLSSPVVLLKPRSFLQACGGREISYLLINTGLNISKV